MLYTVAEEDTADWGWLSIMNACVSAQQLEGKWGGGGSLQKMRLFLRPFLGKIATTVILKRCLSTSPYSQMTVVVDTKTARETA